MSDTRFKIDFVDGTYDVYEYVSENGRGRGDYCYRASGQTDKEARAYIEEKRKYPVYLD